MFIWACGPPENFPNEEMLIGQVNIKMKGLTEKNDGLFLLEDRLKVCLSNKEVGDVHVQITYKSV